MTETTNKPKWSPETTQKNGAKPKSLMSRKIKKKYKMETKRFGKPISLIGSGLKFNYCLKRIKFSFLITTLFLFLMLNQSCVSFKLEQFSKSKTYSEKLIPLELRRSIGPSLSYSEVYVPTNNRMNGLFFDYKIKYATYNIDWAVDKNKNKIKKLWVYDDIREMLDSVYSQISPNELTTELFSNSNVKPVESALKSIIDKRNNASKDMTIAFKLLPDYGFIKDLDGIYKAKMNGILTSGEDFNGYIVYDFVNLKRKAPWPWIVFSSLTLFSINFIGFPIMEQKSDLTLQVTIYDKNWNMVKSYMSSAKKSSYSAMYWGYSMLQSFPKGYYGDIQRASNAKTFSAALSGILEQINNDIPYINSQLRKEKL